MRLVFVKTLTGRTVTLDVNPRGDIEEIKNKTEHTPRDTNHLHPHTPHLLQIDTLLVLP